MRLGEIGDTVIALGNYSWDHKAAGQPGRGQDGACLEGRRRQAHRVPATHRHSKSSRSDGLNRHVGRSRSCRRTGVALIPGELLRPWVDTGRPGEEPVTTSDVHDGCTETSRVDRALLVGDDQVDGVRGVKSPINDPRLHGGHHVGHHCLIGRFVHCGDLVSDRQPR
jgi:hypothetical protein